MPLQNGTRYGNRTRLTYVKGMCPKPIDEPSKRGEPRLQDLVPQRGKYPGDVALKTWRS